MITLRWEGQRSICCEALRNHFQRWSMRICMTLWLTFEANLLVFVTLWLTSSNPQILSQCRLSFSVGIPSNQTQCLRWPWKQWTNLWLGWNLRVKCSFCLLDCHGLSAIWMQIVMVVRHKTREQKNVSSGHERSPLAPKWWLFDAFCVVFPAWHAFVIPRSQGVGRIRKHKAPHTWTS